MTYQIISDSTCDLSPEQVKKYNIHLMPLYVQLGDKTFRDGVDIHPDDIYAHVAAGGDLAATAAVNLADYVQVFSEYSRKASPSRTNPAPTSTWADESWVLWLRP